MKILGLYTRNVKKIKVVELSPKPHMNVIAGQNGEGKTSLLDSIMMALGGKDYIPSKPIREGEEDAEVVLDLGDYKVRRHWTDAEHTYLKVENSDGAKITNGQSILDRLIGKLSFDPLAFSTMEPAKRLEALQKLTGLDFSALNKTYKETYDKRRDIGKMGEQAAANLKQYDDVVEMELPVDTQEELLNQKGKLQEANNNIRAAQTRIQMKDQQISNLEAQVKDFDAEFERLKVKKENVLNLIQKEKEELEIIKEEAQKPLNDTTELDAKLQSIQTYNANKKRVEDKKRAALQVESHRTDYANCTKQLQEIEDNKKKQLSEAKMPIEGLSLGETEVNYNGVPFAQLSTSEQIRVSFAMAIAMNPRLKIAFVKDGSLLDSKAMKAIEEIAVAADFQLWIERVADTPEADCVYIENGEIKGADNV